MAPSYPSIQSFYKRELTSVGETETETEKETQALSPGDGFTEEEKTVELDPLSRPFNPTREYRSFDIGALQPRLSPVQFSGRVVNFRLTHGRSKSQASATGWYNMIVKDDTGAICVKLYFAHKSYALKLGLLITIWTPVISVSPSHDSFTIPSAPIFTSIFPGRDTTVHILIQPNSDLVDICSTPLGYSRKREISGLMNLRNFIDGGHEVADPKILVCVKSIGMRKTFTSKKTGEQLDLVEVVVFDDKSQISFKLWKEMIPSAKEWKPSETVLLISSPALKADQRGREPSLAMTYATMVDVNPVFADADWLRRYAMTLMKRESVRQEFPEDAWDIDAACNGANRILFTIADVDEFVRSGPKNNFTGFLSLIIMELPLVLIRQRNMLMCTECCGVPIYANSPLQACKNCSKTVPLFLNPKVVGTLIDETGSISPGKLLWSPRAWEELFGRPVEELVASSAQEIRWMEQRMVFMRVTVVFGWAETVGKLAVLGVRM